MLPPMIRDEIQRRIKQAMKDGNVIEKEVLRVALGDIQTAESREGADTKDGGSDATSLAVLRKLVKSVSETLEVTQDPGAKATLAQEITVLKSLIPGTLSVDQILLELAPVAGSLKAAPSDGAATGIAMKTLKAKGAEVSGKDVTEAVKKLRS